RRSGGRDALLDQEMELSSASLQCRSRSKKVLMPKSSCVLKQSRYPISCTALSSSRPLGFSGTSRSVSDWHGSQRRAVRAAKYERRAFHLQRSGSSLKYPNQLQALAPTSHRRRISFDAINKMSAGQS